MEALFAVVIEGGRLEKRGRQMVGRTMNLKAVAFDVDWAPDFAVQECMSICNEAGVPATFYATHRSPILEAMILNKHFEVGIHPNFMPGSSHGKNYADVISYCLDLVPNASSMRTHSLYQNSRMFAEIAGRIPNLIDASLYLPGYENIRPFDFELGEGLSIKRIPFFWEDDFFAGTRDCDWNANPASTDGINIFVFHPIHVALNMNTMRFYEEAKLKLPVAQWTKEFVAANAFKGAGSRTYLERLVSAFPKEQFRTVTELAS